MANAGGKWAVMSQSLPLRARPNRHAVIVPLFGHHACHGLEAYLESLVAENLCVVLVDNNPEESAHRARAVDDERDVQRHACHVGLRRTLQTNKDVEISRLSGDGGFDGFEQNLHRGSP